MRPLHQRTPEKWASIVLEDTETLLLDHLQCELKAAATALSLLSKNPEIPSLVNPMIQVAEEEMDHYRMIHSIIVERGYKPERIKPGPYMGLMRKRSSKEPHQPLLDRLLLSALVEARSCERFRLLEQTSEDAQISQLFADLVGPEAQHFNLYVDLAKDFFPEKQVNQRFRRLSQLESEVLSYLEPGPALHSGWSGL